MKSSFPYTVKFYTTNEEKKRVEVVDFAPGMVVIIVDTLGGVERVLCSFTVGDLKSNIAAAYYYGHAMGYREAQMDFKNKFFELFNI